MEVIGNYSFVKLFRTNTRRFLCTSKSSVFPPVVVVIIASLGVFLIAGPIIRPVTQLHCETVFCRSSGAALAWHSHCITSHPTQSTRCQLRPGLMNKFMRCTGFVGLCGHRGVERWIQTKCHRSLVVLVWGQSGGWCLNVPTSRLQEFCLFVLHEKTTAFWFNLKKQNNPIVSKAH